MKPRYWLWLFGVTGLVGGALRVAFFLQRRSMWQDECFLALNVLTRPLTTLLGSPLDFDQTAPPLFLAIEWIASRALGASELSLRAPSLVAGLLLLPALGYVAFRILPPACALLAFALAAISPHLIRYSAEVKPYGFDALLTVVIVGLVIELWRRPASRGRWRALQLVGVLAVLVSTTAPFVLAPAWLALVLSAEVRRSEGTRVRLAVAAVTWGVLWIALYFFSYQPVASSAVMHDFWRHAFLTPDPVALARLHRRWTMPSLFGDLELGLPPGAGVLVVLASLAGPIWIWRRFGHRALVLVAGPVALAYLASLLRRYPIEGRLMSYATPLLFLAIGGALVWTLELTRRVGLRVVILATSGLLLLPGSLAFWRGGQLVAWLEEVRPLLADSTFRSHPKEPLYIFGKAMPAWIYYTTSWSSADSARTTRLLELARRIGPNSGNAPSRGRPVQQEGYDLRVQDGDRRLLVGIPTGYRAVFRMTWESPPVDAGWGANEAERLLHESAPCGWILFTHHKPSELEAFDEAIVGRGAVRAYQQEEPGAAILRYCRRGS